MVSDGQDFKLWIPPQNKFVVGSDNADNYQPDKRLENMRPQYIYDALLLPEIGRDDAVLENGYEPSWTRSGIGSKSRITACW